VVGRGTVRSLGKKAARGNTGVNEKKDLIRAPRELGRERIVSTGPFTSHQTIPLLTKGRGRRPTGARFGLERMWSCGEE